jgi:hypothetical protein
MAAEEGAMTELRWTPTMVEERLVEAADVLNRLPETRMQGFYSLSPAIAASFDDRVGQTPLPMSRSCPSPAAIDRMEEALGWFKWLEQPDTKIVWLRASGERWKTVCHEVGLARAAANEHWLYALCVIAQRLNRRNIPGKWSRTRVFAMVRRKRKSEYWSE